LTFSGSRRGHGRLEERTSTVSSQLNDFLDWPYPEQVFKLERRITTLKATKIQEQTIMNLKAFGNSVQPQINADKL